MKIQKAKLVRISPGARRTEREDQVTHGDLDHGVRFEIYTNCIVVVDNGETFLVYYWNYICDKNLQQAGAVLCQAQVKLE